MGLGQTTDESTKWYPVRANRRQQAIIAGLCLEAESREAGYSFVKADDIQEVVGVTGDGSVLKQAGGEPAYAEISDEAMEKFTASLDAAEADRFPAADPETPRQAALRRMRNKKAAERRRLRKKK